MENFLNDLSCGIIIVNKFGKVLFINDEIAGKLRVDKKFAKELTVDKLFDNEYILELIDKLNKSLNRKSTKRIIKIKDQVDKVIKLEIQIYKENWIGQEIMYIKCKEAQSYDVDVIETVIENSNLESRKQVEREFDFIEKITSNIIFIVDEKGKILKINDMFTKKLGWTEEEVLNVQCDSIIYEEELKERIITADMIESFKKKVSIINTRYITKSGKIMWGQCTFTYFSEAKIFLCITRDITSKKILSDKNKIYEEKLKLEKMRTEFFSSTSHEFKTPLNIILATMQLFNTAIENKEIVATGNIDINRYIKYIKQNSYRLLRLVNNLIDINKMDNGYYEIYLENNNIVEIVEDITMSVSEYADSKGIELIFDTEVEEQIIACDPDKIERVMLNLLSNAIKYTPKNGSISIKIELLENKVIILIEDNGIGIPSGKLDTIFDRYSQIDNDITKTNQGSGIGLALVKSLVELHGGNISVESEINIGSKFIIELPIQTIDIEEKSKVKRSIDSRIEKCNVEFSDIYN